MRIGRSGRRECTTTHPGRQRPCEARGRRPSGPSAGGRARSGRAAPPARSRDPTGHRKPLQHRVLRAVVGRRGRRRARWQRACVDSPSRRDIRRAGGRDVRERHMSRMGRGTGGDGVPGGGHSAAPGPSPLQTGARARRRAPTALTSSCWHHRSAAPPVSRATPPPPTSTAAASSTASISRCSRGGSGTGWRISATPAIRMCGPGDSAHAPRGVPRVRPHSRSPSAVRRPASP